jgi:hypothetical protein
MIGVAANAQIPTQAHWVATTHSFGAISEDDGPVTCTFALVNDGPERLSIISARATCGCTSPKYPTQSFAQGDTAYIEVTFDPQGRPGRFTKHVNVELSGEPQKSRLDISGVVIGSDATVSRRFPVDCGPLKMAHQGIMLGEVIKDRLKTVYVEGYNQSADSIKIAVTARPKWLDIVIAPEVTPAGEQATLICYINSAKCQLYGLVEDSVTISPAEGLSYTMPVTMMVKEDFSGVTADQMSKAPMAVFDSEVVDYGVVDRNGMPVSRSFTLSNVGKSKLEIRRVYSSDPGVTATVDQTSVKKGKKAQVVVTVDPRVQTGALLNSRLIVITNDPLNPTHTIRLVGTY